eukprot:TRINITY_DN5067_c0_g1_i2.p1 TRINITY_DN5067_c0_g1~~TRINITY_DN5067_c0_g1_i2.p1  ORF type:complete len:1016 (+),score=241.57 TRINITY_DN5067_c0_g1_i2:129-3176(+)
MSERNIFQSASIDEVPSRKRLRILIVGAGGELGSALSERFAKKTAGHKLVLAGRSKKQLDKTYATCMRKKSPSTEISTIMIEVRKETSCKSVIDSTATTLGGLDLVIYASSKDVKGKIEEIEDFVKLSKKVMETIFFGAVYTAKHALPHLTNSKGQLVVFSASESSTQHAAIYMAAKHSIKGFFETIKKESSVTISVIEEMKKSSPAGSQLAATAPPPPKLEASGSDENVPDTIKLSIDEIMRIIRRESKSHGRPNLSRSRTQSLRLPKVVQLQDAIKKGRLDQVKVLLRDLPLSALESGDEQDKTALHLAAHYGMPQIAKLLLKKKASLMAKDKEGFTPVLTAAASGHVKVLVLMISKATPAELKVLTPRGESLLHLLAISAPQQQELKQPLSPLMSARLSTLSQPMTLTDNVSPRASSVISPRATISSSSGNISQVLGNEFMKDLAKVLRLLVEKGAVDLDVKDESNATPLHRACENGQYELVAWMLRNGAAVNMQDKVGDTPLHHAVRSGNRTVVKYLVDNNADPTIVGEKGKPFEQPDILPKILEFWTSHQEAQEAKKQAAATAAAQTAAAVAEKKSTPSVARASVRPSSTVQKKPKDDKEEGEKTPEIDESELKKKEPIVVHNFEELPTTYHSLIKRAELDFDKINQNWEVFVHVLRFVTRKNFKAHGPNSHEPVNVSSGHLSVDDDENGSSAVEEAPEPEKKTKKKRREPKSRSNVQSNIKQATEQFLSTDNPKKTYKILDQAGKGGFGSVYLAKSGVDKKRYAIKKMPHSTVKERRQNIDEVIFLKQCDHPNIVKLFSAYDLGEEIWLVMEFMEGGSLQEAVNLCKFKENQIAYVAKEMLKGIKYLHTNNLAHRDLKSANVMMSVEGDVKLIDFGLCIDTTVVQSCHMVGSPYWTPPEMIRKEIHGLPADIWSFGICMIEMANGKPPNIKSALKAMFNAAVEPPPTLEDPSWSSQFVDFMSLALKKDTKERATADDLLKHEFLTKAATKKSMNGILGSVFVDKSIGIL